MAFKFSYSTEVYGNIFLLIMCSVGVFLRSILELLMFTVSHENASFKTDVYFPSKKSKNSSRQNLLNSFLTPEKSPNTWATTSTFKLKICLVSEVVICCLYLLRTHL